MKSTASTGVVLGFGLMLAACGGGGSPAEPSAAATPQPTPAPTPAPTATYRVVFSSSWSRTTHPVDFPPNPHFSPLIGGTHDARVRFWEEGGTASDGIEAMAERGNPALLAAEVEAALAAGTAQRVLLGDGIGASPGSVSLEFEIARDFPLVTLVSMLAPSPDWFAGVHDLDLLEGGDWAAERTVTLHAYDAGTDSGTTYDSRNRDTQPREPITRIAGFPLEAGGGVAPVGTFTFTRLQ